jgi:hypothetical protein
VFVMWIIGIMFLFYLNLLWLIILFDFIVHNNSQGSGMGLIILLPLSIVAVFFDYNAIRFVKYKLKAQRS